MHIILINAAGTRTEHDFATLEQAAGEIGSKCTLILDGRVGYLDRFPSKHPTTPADGPTEVAFIETDPIFQYFSYAHLPEHLQAVSRWFYDLAERIVLTLPRNAERTVALRKLLESKDAAVRARLAK